MKLNNLIILIIIMDAHQLSLNESLVSQATSYRQLSLTGDFAPVATHSPTLAFVHGL